MENKNIVLIYYNKNKNDIPMNGPRVVVKGILNQWEKMGVKFVQIPVNPSSIKDVIKVINISLFSRNNIINVHQSGYKIPFIVYIISKLNKNNRYFYSIHGCESLQNLMMNKSNYKLRNFIEKILISNFDNIICVSKLQMNDILKTFKVKGSINYVNNAYNNEINLKENINSSVKYDKENLNFLLAGGIKRNKGIFESIELIKYIKNKNNYKNIKLKIIGDYIESDFEQFKEYIKENKLENNIEYIGFLNDKKEVYKLYLESDYILSLSYYDTFNISVIEALSLGKPVIVSSKTGASVFVKNEDIGLVIDLQEINYKYILNYINANILKENKDNIRNRKEIVSKLNWKNTAEKYLEIFTNIKI